MKQLTPDIPIVSEERVSDGEIPETAKGTFWTVDPLDGTAQFIKRTGAFVVAISLVVDNKPVLGVIYHPVFGITYSGYGPGTASKIGADGARAALPLPHALRQEMRVLANEPHTNMDFVRGYLSEQFGEAAKIDTRSGIFRACQIAEGSADMGITCAIKRNGGTWWWDAAPGHAIVEAAGGRVETTDGKPLRYETADLLVPPHVIVSPQRTQQPGFFPLKKYK